MDIDSLYLDLAENERQNCIPPEIKTEWERLQSKNCSESFTADACGKFFLECAVTNTENMTSKNLGFSKKNSDVRRCYASGVRPTAVMMLPRPNLNSKAKEGTYVC